MSPVVEADSFVLAQASFGLLAAGREGAALLAELGVGHDGFDGELEALLAALRAGRQADAGPLRALVERIAGLAARARGRLTVSSLRGDVVPAYVFPVDDVLLVARPVGPTIEWLLLDPHQLHRLVTDVVRPDNAVLVSVASGGMDLAAVTVAGGEVSLAARDQVVLGSLEAAAERGLEGLVRRLLDLIDDSGSTP